MTCKAAAISYPISYFGYGSNLWLEQMSKRCPTSKYVGVARLLAYRWLINERRYANVLETNSPKDAVYGLVYLLEKEDEGLLDQNENVPWAYQKMWLSVDFWRAPLDKADKWVDVTDETKTEKMAMLVYVDPTRVHDSEPWYEYIYRMNKGIDDALALGIPRNYINEVLRQYIKPETGTEDETVKDLAEKQAARFVHHN